MTDPIVPPNPEFPVVPMTGTTELRTHGVSGTPVESMLHHPHPIRVAGAGGAGFYRRGDDHAVQFDVVPEGRNLEAYSWGGLTSRSASRAFWLLLVPFMLANVASWVHPVRPKTTFAPIGAMSGLIRLIALSLTITFMVATATVGIDLIAWQCVDSAASCGSRHFFSNFMVKHLADDPGARVAIGALIPAAVLLVLTRLSKSTGKTYEDFGDEHQVVPDGDASGAADLANPNFWAGSRPFQRLRSLHICTAFATLAGIVGYAARGSEVVAWVAAGVAGVCAVVILSPLAGRRRSLLSGQEPPRAVGFAMEHAQWAGVALFAVAVGMAVSAPTRVAGADVPPTPPGLNWFIGWVLRGQLALLVLYVIVTWVARAKSPDTNAQTLVGRTLFRSFGAPILAILALGLAGAYASGLVFRIADYLGDPCRTNCPDSAIVVAPTYYFAAPAAIAALLAGSTVFAVAKIWLRRRVRCCTATVAMEYGQPAGSPRVVAIAKAQASASLTDRADLFLTSYLVLTIAGMALLQLARNVTWVTTLGTWLVGVIAFGLVYLGRSAYASDTKRRTVGILWDLGTFWPRAAHPFAPPCYCERVVPEFTSRIKALTAHGDVVISAHSQGTVIAAAVVHRLGPEHSKKVGLVTYGCPLERLYARMFPHFFGAAELARARANLDGCWRNLYRRTDPIGGPVFTLDLAAWTCGKSATSTTDSVDVRLIDPEFAMPPGEFEDLAPRGHSDYFHDAMFPMTITRVAECIPAK